MELFDDDKKEERLSRTRVPHKIVINELGDFNGDGSEDLRDIVYSLRQNKRNTLTRLEGNGDFRSAECVALLKEADVVVTNPPFSLFREYVAQLVEHQKKFLIVGNKNALKYREIFPLIKENKMWTGYRGFSGGMWFYTHHQVATSKTNDGKTLANVPSIWFTNLDHKKRHEEMILFKKYSPERYVSYDNFDGIDVPNTADIPCDYPGMMGVPITFLDKFNPEQFEIIGLSTGDIAKSIGVSKNYRGRTDVQYTVNGVPKCPYERLIIRNKHPQEGL